MKLYKVTHPSVKPRLVRADSNVSAAYKVSDNMSKNEIEDIDYNSFGFGFQCKVEETTVGEYMVKRAIKEDETYIQEASAKPKACMHIEYLELIYTGRGFKLSIGCSCNRVDPEVSGYEDFIEAQSTLIEDINKVTSNWRGFAGNVGVDIIC